METLYFLPYWLTPLWMQGSSSALTLSVFSLSQNTAKTLSARIPPYLMCNLCIVLHDEHNLINMQSLLVRRAHSLWWIFLESSGPTVDLREEYPWKGDSVTVSAMIMLEKKKLVPTLKNLLQAELYTVLNLLMTLVPSQVINHIVFAVNYWMF